MAEDTCQNTLHAFIVSSLGNCRMGNFTFNAVGLISSTLPAAESVAHFPNHVIWQLAFTVQQIKLYGTDELPAHNRAEISPKAPFCLLAVSLRALRFIREIATGRHKAHGKWGFHAYVYSSYLLYEDAH